MHCDHTDGYMFHEKNDRAGYRGQFTGTYLVVTAEKNFSFAYMLFVVSGPLTPTPPEIPYRHHHDNRANIPHSLPIKVVLIIIYFI